MMGLWVLVICMALVLCMVENCHNGKKLFPDVLISGSIYNGGGSFRRLMGSKGVGIASSS